MTEYWEDESDAPKHGGVGVVRHRPHRIIRHRAAAGALRQVLTVGCVIMACTVAAATLATSVSVRDTSAAARWMPDAPSGPTSDPQSDVPAPGEGSGGVDPAEDAERRSAVGASVERADRQRRTPSAPPSSASNSSPPVVTQVPADPTPPADSPSDPVPEPTPDPCDPKEQDDDGQPEPEPGEPTEPGSDGDEVPPVDSEPAPAQPETGG